MWGYLNIFIGVFIFAGTVPMTKLALFETSSYDVAVLRILVGGFLGAAYLIWKAKLSVIREHFKLTALTVLGVGGFPFLISHAMEGLPATYGSVALGIIPLIAGLISIIFFKEKVQKSFYPFAVLGSVSVVVYGISANSVPLYSLVILALSIVVAATSYVTGSQLAKKTSGPLAISASLSLLLPVAIVLMFASFDWQDLNVLSNSSASTLGALIYLATLSQFLGFFPFYSGLSSVGVAKGIQIQLLQPFIGLLMAIALMRDEHAQVSDFVALSIVLFSVYMANRKEKKLSEPAFNGEFREA